MNARADGSHLMNITRLTLVYRHRMNTISHNPPFAWDQVLNIRNCLRCCGQPLGVVNLVREVLLEVIWDKFDSAALGMLPRGREKRGPRRLLAMDEIGEQETTDGSIREAVAIVAGCSK